MLADRRGERFIVQPGVPGKYQINLLIIFLEVLT
jgi:hypothetical protein